MTTTVTTITGTSYVKINSSGDDYTLQNTGNTDLYLLFADAAPADSDTGFILKPLDGMTKDSWGDSDIYCRLKYSPNSVGQITVSKA